MPRPRLGLGAERLGLEAERLGLGLNCLAHNLDMEATFSQSYG